MGMHTRRITVVKQRGETMPDYKAIKKVVTTQLLKALEYLAYSHNKIQKLPDVQAKLDAESLETWESYAARFSRVADIFLMKYIRSCILEDDPGFKGSFRDFINRAAKLGLIDDVERWMTIRALRNLSVHEYADEDMTDYFQKLKQYTPTLLTIKAQLKV